MPYKVSIETVGALFRLHDYSDDLYAYPEATRVLQEIILDGLLTEACFISLESGIGIDAFPFIVDLVIKVYADQLNTAEFFTVIDVLSFLKSMVTQMDISGSVVFEFLCQNLKLNYQNHNRSWKLNVPKKTPPFHG